jgi:hypothetical protein
MLSGADLFQGSATVDKVHFHTNSNATLQIFGTGDSQYGIIDLSAGLGSTESICGSYDAPIYVIFTDNSGDITGENVEGTVAVGTYVPSSTPGEAGTFTPATSSSVNQAIKITKPAAVGIETWAGAARTFTAGEQVAVFVDYYLDKAATSVDELQIAADNFAGNFYVEADTLFRRKSDGKDLPANLTFPNAKIQSNFTFSLSGTGDPSTFTFTMDALPGYTYFDKSREVLCVIQVVEDQNNADKKIQPIMPHNNVLEHNDTEIDDALYIGYGVGDNDTKGNPSQAEG